MGPLLSPKTHAKLHEAVRAGVHGVECSLDLERTQSTVEIAGDGWRWQGQDYPFLENCRERTIYHWTGAAFEPVSRYTSALIKLVPTEWGPPTFEIDGIKMLPTLNVSPYEDAGHKVRLVEPRGKRILDTCGGLGYFADWCLRLQAHSVLSCEKNPDVIWLRGLNPWSPAPGEVLTLVEGDVSERIREIPSDSVDAALHDPPRFGIAGDLYSQRFYDQLARVLRRDGRLFHYTGSPNSRSRGRDLAGEVSTRLQRAGFETRAQGDGVLAVKRRSHVAKRH